MSLGINKVILIGHLGRDPEKVEGNEIAKIAIATTERWKDKQSGEQQEKTEWHRVTGFGHSANSMMKYLYKGAKVYIEGKLVTNKWEKDGQTHYTTEVHVQKYQLLSPVKDQPEQAEQSSQPEQQQNQPADPCPSSNEGFDDDIPF